MTSRFPQDDVETPAEDDVETPAGDEVVTVSASPDGGTTPPAVHTDSRDHDGCLLFRTRVRVNHDATPSRRPKTGDYARYCQFLCR
ncbi:hypothetical protein [Streptomyces platensis]|uniref:hypothetical protein n=1 Tax=Streptomyces platensis TaxID=58346 RepID=UPI0033251405